MDADNEDGVEGINQKNDSVYPKEKKRRSINKTLKDLHKLRQKGQRNQYDKNIVSHIILAVLKSTFQPEYK